MWRRTIDEIKVSEIDLPVRALPEAMRGLVACQISDFHVDRDEDLERLAMAVEAINLQQPDLVFLTGDYFSGPDTMHRYLGAFRDALKNLRPQSGLFAILGNHDHWSSADRITEALKRAGADVLANDSRRCSCATRNSSSSASTICGRGAPNLRARSATSTATIARSCSRTIPTPRSTRAICGRA